MVQEIIHLCTRNRHLHVRSGLEGPGCVASCLQDTQGAGGKGRDTCMTCVIGGQARACMEVSVGSRGRDRSLQAPGAWQGAAWQWGRDSSVPHPGGAVGYIRGAIFVNSL